MSQQLPRLATVAADATTRFLCSSTYVSPDLARLVHEHTTERYRAICPSSGIDLVAVARHADLALRIRASRDRTLALLFVFGCALGVMVVVLAPGTAASVTVVVIAAACLLLAWVLRTVREKDCRLKARALVVDMAGAARDTAPPVEAGVEARLEGLDATNVIVFPDNVDGWESPFVGSGLRLGRWQLTVDVRKPGTDPAGGRRVLAPFDAVDVHSDLAKTIKTSVGGDLLIRNRLYVNGGQLGSGRAGVVPGLLPSASAAPVTRVDSRWVKDALRNPGVVMRTYLCLEKVAWGGELVVSMFVRAELTAGILTVEGWAHVLPPLHPKYHEATEYVRMSKAEVVFRSAASQLGKAPAALLLALPTLLGSSGDGAAPARHETRAAEKAIRKQQFDYGARQPLREMAADFAATNFFFAADVERDLKVLQRRILEALEKFLDRHGVDTSDFTSQQQNIVNNTTYNMGDINTQNAVVGSHGRINNMNVNGGQSTGNQAGRNSPPAPQPGGGR